MRTLCLFFPVILQRCLLHSILPLLMTVSLQTSVLQFQIWLGLLCDPLQYFLLIQRYYPSPTLYVLRCGLDPLYRRFLPFPHLLPLLCYYFSVLVFDRPKPYHCLLIPLLLRLQLLEVAKTWQKVWKNEASGRGGMQGVHNGKQNSKKRWVTLRS